MKELRLTSDGACIESRSRLVGVCSSLQRPSPRSEWRRPGLTFQEERPPGMSAKSVTLLPRSIWRGTGFEPSTSWSRTSLDQTKSVELTAFACAFPPLIWATWATKYRFASVRDVHPRGSTSSEPASRAGLELKPCANRTALARQFD